MRKLVVATLVCLACVAPARAQKAVQPVMSPMPEDLENANPKPNQQQRKDTPSVASIEDGLRTRLSRAGFKDIELIPTSFLVRAKDADGKPVMLMVSPDSVVQWRPVAPQDGEDHTVGSATPPALQEKF